jgi:hypothetical protein
MDRIRESADWAQIQRSEPGGLYDRCVRAMDRVCFFIAGQMIPNACKLILPLEVTS